MYNVYAKYFRYPHARLKNAIRTLHNNITTPLGAHEVCSRRDWQNNPASVNLSFYLSYCHAACGATVPVFMRKAGSPGANQACP